MASTSDPLEHIQARRYLEEVNNHILHGGGKLLESPGKLSLVWTDLKFDTQRFLAVKPAGDASILVNGRRYPATEASLKEALVNCLREMKGTT